MLPEVRKLYVESTLEERSAEAKPYEPIKTSEITPLRLALFLKLLPTEINGASYPNIFDVLHQLPREKQKKLLVGFYTEGVTDFPNGELLAKELVRTNNIDWFKPKEEPDPTLLQELVDQHLERLNLPRAPIKIIDDWAEAEEITQDISKRHTPYDNDVWNAVEDVGCNTTGEDMTTWYDARNTAWDAAYSVALTDASHAVYDVTGKKEGGVVALATALDAGSNAEWVVVEDKMTNTDYNKGNPYSPKMGIYELGCKPVGLVQNKEGQEEYVIFIPRESYSSEGNL